jgi:hypothetical protein
LERDGFAARDVARVAGLVVARVAGLVVARVAGLVVARVAGLVVAGGADEAVARRASPDVPEPDRVADAGLALRELRAPAESREVGALRLGLCDLAPPRVGRARVERVLAPFMRGDPYTTNMKTPRSPRGKF